MKPDLFEINNFTEIFLNIEIDIDTGQTLHIYEGV